LIANKLSRPAATPPQDFHQWQRVIDDFAALLGLTLVVYDQNEYLLATSHANRICDTIQLKPEGLRLCEQDCGSMLSQVAGGGELATFKCHAHLYNFAAPVKVRDKIRYVLLGGRVFRNYQDFTKFNRMASSYGVKDFLFVDWDNAVKFENAQYFQRAASFLQSLADTFSQAPDETDKVKQQSYQMSTLYELAGVLGAEHSVEKVFQLALEALGVLFDISGGAVLRRAVNGSGFEALSVLGSIVQPSFELKPEEHTVLDDLKQDRYFYIDETYPILRMGFPETVHSIHSFPVLSRNQTAWVLQVYNTELSSESVQMLQIFCQHVVRSLENLLLKQEVSERSKALSVVTDFGMAIGSELESLDLYRTILLKTIEIMRAEQGSLLIFDEVSKELSIKCIKGLSEKLVEKLRLKPGQGIAGFVFETGLPLLIENIGKDPRFQAHQRARYKTKSFLSVPLRIRSRKIGVLNVADKIDGAAFDQTDLRLLETIADHAWVALERSDLYQKSEDLRRISITDPLTELYNRRFFQDRLTEEIERAKRHSQSLSLIMLDIDNFKNYNDTHGHLAGDEALRITATILKNTVRNIDLVARYGGEEFAVILPMTDVGAAHDIAERIRSGMANRFFPDHSLTLEAKLRVSLGIACFPKDSDSLFELISNADKALYLAKVSGKNLVSVFDRAQNFKSASGL
jgi:diguanylate cyclase (GGDEF)-like protein